jgi:hypothetical protein
MADFCKTCSEDMFGEDLDQCKAIEPDDLFTFLCEGCGGYVTVNRSGDKVPCVHCGAEKVDHKDGCSNKIEPYVTKNRVDKPFTDDDDFSED